MDTENKDIDQLNFEVNTLYMMALAMDLLLRDTEKLMLKNNEGWKYEKKQAFKRYLEYVKSACIVHDKIYQDIVNIEASNKFKYFQVWQEEANELVRFILMIADRTSKPDVVNKIHAFIREQPSDGVATEELLSRYYLKKTK